MARPPRARAPLKEAALHLFVENGIHATGIREIARHAKCSEAALYRHWANKDALVGNLFHEHLHEVVGLLDREITAHDVFADKVRACSRAAFGLYDQQPLVFRFVLLVRHEMAGHIEDGTRMPQDVIEELMTVAIADHRRATVAAAAALGAFLQTAEYVIYQRLPGPLSTYADEVADLVIRLAQ